VLSSPIPVSLRRRGSLPFAAKALCGAVALAAAFAPHGATAQSMFAAADLDPQRFVVVASPVGSSSRYQLNIYEQVRSTKPCFAIGAGKPAAVNPLLATFDFTGICSRYIDANGYSVRVGPSDLAGTYRLLVRSEAGDTLLIALPTKPGAGPEMVVARAGGAASGFHKLDLEPSWRLMRRQFRGRNLGHVYLFNETWPGATSPGSAAAPLPAGGSALGAAPAAASPSPQTVPGPKAASGLNGSAATSTNAAPVKPAPLPAAPPKI